MIKDIRNLTNAHHIQDYVLIVDDEEDIVFFIELFFRRKNKFVKKAPDIATAAKLIAETAPAILIMDDHLPDGSGWNFTKNKLATLPKTFVIFISAHLNKMTSIEGLGSDNYFIMEKPFTIEQLEEKIQASNHPMLQNLVE